MNKNILLLGLMLGALLFLRRQSGGRSVQGQMESGATGVPGIPGTTGMWGEG
jgi:hypothetical protein